MVGLKFYQSPPETSEALIRCEREQSGSPGEMTRELLAWYISDEGLRRRLLPVLPPRRRRALTLPALPEPLTSSVVSGVSNSAFFQQLPLHLRRDILIEAFGNRTLHLTVCFDHPPVPLRERILRPSRKYHAALSRFYPSNLQDFSKPKLWHWRSSTCHRAAPGLVETVKPEESPYEKCLEGESHGCDSWPGEWPSKCFVGSLGWLLSCRQAYSEGIDILYSTNVFQIEGNTLIKHIPRFLLPQRLNSITSIELLWRLDPSLNCPETSFSAFHALVERLSDLFPHLTKLHFSLLGQVKVPCRIVESDVLVPLDNMVRGLAPQLQKCTVAIPATVYERVIGEELWPWVNFDDKLEPIWRALPDSDNKAGNEASGTQQLEGYWLLPGQWDLPDFHMCGAFGLYDERGRLKIG